MSQFVIAIDIGGTCTDCVVLDQAGVSTVEQAQSGAGLSAQRAAVHGECERRGWQIVESIEDAGYSAGLHL